MDEEAKSDYVPADEYEEWEQLNKAKTSKQKYYENIAEDMLEADPMDLAKWIEEHNPEDGEDDDEEDD